ncbi:bifunctional proline dehydrogenase/L-glutamate gamma-semialdehyde dehydrogenase PutA [Candidatus Carsonella ruddii]|uniref:Bifunctional protein PutA n=1 Tax=Candidatus Carsonella ruddii PC isolate NHV TaxID=1202540 RepID=J3Z217_CARRU|nr:bifunctional proline dehydrogenase/L-glutamate gamma-semialdehyde dehydrogenase PutA [Candidatus Carsonella ruddii]AFP84304.1 delta-1-pyrroline-5-carboxylate dehydrogenase [Candidatus Carsonella ruddii PC isolate NHV]
MNNFQLLNIISKYYLIEDNIYLLELLKNCYFKNDFFKKVKEISLNLTNEARKNLYLDNLDNLLGEYNLSTKEGIQLMCLAESLLRIPDFYSADSFIKDKISFQDWSYYYSSDYWKIIFYNMIIDFCSIAYYKFYSENKNMFIKIFKKTVVFFSNYVMKHIGKKFVYSSDIVKAVQKSISDKNIYSFDMLGEAALTYYDARKFFNQYKLAINEIRKCYTEHNFNERLPSISIKLSALNPKYSFFNIEQIMRDMIPLIKILIYNAKEAFVSITIDAEEVDRLELSLILFNNIFYSKLCKNWGKFGIVVQAYSKRAIPILYWLNYISIEQNKTIPVRLVKGAYWDYEIKYSQTLNLPMYPVYINKFCTDLSYLLCSIYMLSNLCKTHIYPQFATHNIQTISFILTLSNDKNYEFQKLYGMGDDVYRSLKKIYNITYREYAPIGKYKELLPYLVRRLLENGANSSFVNKVIDKNISLHILNKNPFKINNKKYNSKIPLPVDLFGGTRNSIFFYNLNISFHNYNFYKKINLFYNKKWIATSYVNNSKKKTISYSPFNNYSVIGILKHDFNINNSIKILKKSFFLWKSISIFKKVKIIKNFILLLKHNFIELILMCCKEAGKTIIDSISDIKEAIDFCYYYCNQAILLNKKVFLPCTTGENNIYMLEGKGIFSAISPWNFPVAIFCGQLISALLSGNVVLVKPAESTSLIAFKILKLLFKSGIPISVCQLIIGKGSTIGNEISYHKDICGIIFTGSNEVANIISKNLIMRQNTPLYKLIAETGGINTLLVDSTALIEQVVYDIVESAFKSCGQRCSALRLVYINENIYFDTLKLLMSVLLNINVGNPLNLSYDIGPIITKKNFLSLNKYINTYKKKNVYFKEEKHFLGNFINPTLIRVNSINDLKSEQFGPILHISIFKNNQIDQIISDINHSNFGLTLGIHSRNEAFYKYLSNNLKIGNIYINRNTIGAIVGMQPFGGCNLSGTGPKAGGCNYLLSLINEKTITINTTAQGGNTILLNE